MDSELLTSDGRIDMVVETEDNVFIIEFKCNQDANILIGINFDTEARNIENYLVE